MHDAEREPAEDEGRIHGAAERLLAQAMDPMAGHYDVADNCETAAEDSACLVHKKIGRPAEVAPDLTYRVP